jgi:hypothetical protein
LGGAGLLDGYLDLVATPGGAGHTAVPARVQAVTLTGKLRGCVSTALGTDGTSAGPNVTRMTCPWFVAANHSMRLVDVDRDRRAGGSAVSAVGDSSSMKRRSMIQV